MMDFVVYWYCVYFVFAIVTGVLDPNDQYNEYWI